MTTSHKTITLVCALALGFMIPAQGGGLSRLDLVTAGTVDSMVAGIITAIGIKMAIPYELSPLGLGIYKLTIPMACMAYLDGATSSYIDAKIKRAVQNDNINDTRWLLGQTCPFYVSPLLKLLSHESALNNALHHVQSGGMVHLLVENDAVVHNRNVKKQTPLHVALKPSVAQALIENGADVHARDNQGNTPLFTARSRTPLVLIENDADHETHNKAHQTALQAQASQYTQQRRPTRALLEGGAKMIENEESLHRIKRIRLD